MFILFIGKCASPIEFCFSYYYYKEINFRSTNEVVYDGNYLFIIYKH